MPKQKSWAMSAVVVGTYLCAIYGAQGPRVVARPPVRPVGQPIVRTDAPAPVTVCDAGR